MSWRARVRTPRPPRVWALLDEAALHRRVGDAAIMYEQLMHLLEISRQRSVSVQVLPGMEAHVGLQGAFTIAEKRGQATIVNVEDIADGRVSDDPVTVDEVTLRFKSLQTGALSVRASQDLIAMRAEERWKGSSPTGARALTAPVTVDNA